MDRHWISLLQVAVEMPNVVVKDCEVSFRRQKPPGERLTPEFWLTSLSL